MPKERDAADGIGRDAASGDVTCSTDDDTGTHDDETADAQSPGGFQDSNPDMAEDQQTVQFSVVFDDDDDAGYGTSMGDVPSEGLDGEFGGDDADDAAGDGFGSQDNAGAAADNPAAKSDADGTADTDINGNGDTNGNAIAQSSAARANATFELAHTSGDSPVIRRHSAAPAPDSDRKDPQDRTDSSTERIASRLDREIGSRRSDDILLRSYPTFALDHVTVRNRKSGRTVLDSVQMPFYAGKLYAVAVDDDEQRADLLAVMGGFIRIDGGQVMLKSVNINELEINEIRGHRIGLLPQRFALREDLDAVANLVYAMDASGRTFLKPKPVLARELLVSVGCAVAHTGVPVRDLAEIERRRAGIARAICCEATAIVIDEPTAGLSDDEANAVLALLAKIAHTGDPKRCVIMLTSDDADIEAADAVYDVDD
ncbi:ATP-binding cassette domain-containing protein [Bifidobacterium sp.]|uniref:ATP-binding cassette domain-containing protein n=1 Tax=Bifidobacterium sp. TaxID=41200 RepID=UPI0025BC4205|nr:ATP-binding cassette domain-containing protein [Bifidobacterium sp.]MCH4209397.1 ATP-binding cassette domain-containing protein [Bifidobacterium sp.]MCI1224976.1 ATP-binding cassette domain-containing protein [Bifidobacterium sp.]